MRAGSGGRAAGDVQGARQSVERLARLREATTNPKFAYFKSHLDLQHQAVKAWLARAEGKTAAAVEAMKKAAEMEDRLGKHPVSPGPIYPIREQLGELLLELDRPAEALAALPGVAGDLAAPLLRDATARLAQPSWPGRGVRRGDTSRS